MLKSLKELTGFTIQATDGSIGTVDDVYFEADTWMIRYVVVDTGHWLPGRRVLLAPLVIGRPDWAARRLPVALTRQQVRESPDINTALPLLRQEEIELHQHYFWEPYWIPGFGGLIEGLVGPYGFAPTADDEEQPVPPEPERQASWLHSAVRLQGCDIAATDGDAGQLTDFLFDEMAWSIRWLLLDTGRWVPGRQVLIPVSWVGRIARAESSVQLDLTCDLIQSSPPYDPAVTLDSQLEDRLYEHYRKAA